MKTLYTASVTATGGREGRVESGDKNISMKLNKPGPSSSGGTNPEQLFAAGYAGCFSGAVQFLAKQRNLEIGDVSTTAEVSLNQDEDNGFMLSVALDTQLPSLSQTDAENLLHAAHQFCPYSKATRGNVSVTLKLNGQAITSGNAAAA